MTKKPSRKAAVAAELSARSAGHACFIGPRKIENAIVMWRVQDDEVQAGDSELFVDAGGSVLLKAPVESKPMKRVDLNWMKGCRFDGLVRQEGAALICTGANMIEETVTNTYRAALPDATRVLKARREKEVKEVQTKEAKRRGRPVGPGRTETGGRAMKGKNGKTVIENWHELFGENEKLAASGKALTDEKLKAEMYARHPESKKPSTSIERVGSQRSAYNKSTYGFAKLPKPAKPSVEYSSDGKTPAKEAAKTAKAAAKPTKPAKAAKKETSKSKSKAKVAGGKKKVVVKRKK